MFFLVSSLLILIVVWKIEDRFLKEKRGGRSHDFHSW